MEDIMPSIDRDPPVVHMLGDMPIYELSRKDITRIASIRGTDHISVGQSQVVNVGESALNMGAQSCISGVKIMDGDLVVMHSMGNELTEAFLEDGEGIVGGSKATLDVHRQILTDHGFHILEPPQDDSVFHFGVVNRDDEPVNLQKKSFKRGIYVCYNTERVG